MHSTNQWLDRLSIHEPELRVYQFKTTLKQICIAHLLVISLFSSLADSAEFALYPEECPAASLSPTEKLVIVPQNPIAGQPFTVCTLDFIYPVDVLIQQSGSHITLTMRDSDLSFGTNPPVVVGTKMSGLQEGSYLLDVIILEPGRIPPSRSIASDFDFDVAAGIPVPTLSTPFTVLLVILCCLFGFSALLHKKKPGQITVFSNIGR